MVKQFSIRRFGKFTVSLALVLLSGCASLTSQQITQRIDTMSDFQICLGAQTGLDSRALDLDVVIVAAAKERITQRKLDCSTKHDEIVRFLVTSLKQEQRYREIYFPRAGFWRF
uniref:hypothetical protein n=1 Tax=Polynucleobacter sp. TaxID=2029855 RepID=UPI0040471974